ncbi:MAG: DUF2330 domain-containing protein [Sandaracinaceae bacterium]|nr:DUF2330 domain-containing protein [Sandaracinaceae bacterium]
MSNKSHLALAGSALAVALAAAAPAAPAAACGGFFCDAAQPVNQAAERIVFAREPDGSVTAVIQIQYAGAAEEFAWLLPVAGSPEVRVSSNEAFRRLQQATNPQYLLNTIVEGNCRDDRLAFGPSDSAGGGGADAGALAPGPGGVTVVNQGSVGPYDFVVISVDPELPTASDVAVEWLRENGYQIDPSGAARLAPYLEGGMNLLAFRLTKGNDTGAIRPVMLGFGPGLATIPLRPTAVAAVDDMGIMVWVLGPHRAVPVNYRSLELNEALIDWLNPNRNYNAVVTEAANQAGGQGFVTEMSGEARPLADTIFADWELSQWAAASDLSSWGDVRGRLVDVLSTFGSHDGIREVVDRTVPLAPGVDVDAFLSCLGCDGQLGSLDAFDVGAFLSAMEAQVIEPMRQTRALFERSPTVTRFYTTMSADEMSVDPSFAFNPDLPPVAALRQADRIIECSPGISQFEAPWRVVLPNGQTVRGMGNTWPFTVGEEGGLPANFRIRRVGTEGEGEVIVDNGALIAAALADHNARAPRLRTSACSVSPVASGGALFGLFALGALGALAFRRRRS